MANIKISELPLATTPLSGTEEVPIVQGGQTVKVATNQIGGSSATPTLDQVLAAGNTATDKTIIIDNTIQGLVTTIGDGFSGMTVDDNSAFVYGQYRNNLVQLLDTGNSKSVELNIDYITFTVPGYSNQYLYPNPASIATTYLPESDGTIQLQNPRLIGSINITPSTPTVQFNCIHTIVTGASNIILNPVNWKDRITGIFLVDISGCSFSTTGGATIRGAIGGVYGIPVGMVSVMYLQSNNTFYISRT
jgi:hypothetical protein